MQLCRYEFVYKIDTNTCHSCRPRPTYMYLVRHSLLAYLYAHYFALGLNVHKSNNYNVGT